MLMITNVCVESAKSEWFLYQATVTESKILDYVLGDLIAPASSYSLSYPFQHHTLTISVCFCFLYWIKCAWI